MEIAENLPRNLSKGASYTCAFDFAGSGTSNFVGSRIRTCRRRGLESVVTRGSQDFEKNLEAAYVNDTRPMLSSCSQRKRYAIENSFWFCTWRGQVAGALFQAFQTSVEVSCKVLPSIITQKVPDKHSKIRVVIVLSVDGGPITQVEQDWMPELIKDACANISRRGYEWGDDAVCLWCRFPTMEDMVRSLGGVQNLVHDWDSAGHGKDMLGRPLNLVCIPDANDQRKYTSILRKSIAEAFNDQDEGAVKDDPVDVGLEADWPKNYVSMAELVDQFRAPILFASSPEMGLRRGVPTPVFDIEVMKISENLPKHMSRGTSFACTFDFAGSSTSRFANSRVRDVDEDGHVLRSDTDFSMSYEEAYEKDDRAALPTCSDVVRRAIENSYWFCMWFGLVSGGLMQSFQTSIDVKSATGKESLRFPGISVEKTVRVVIVASVDGGPITQVEKDHLPQIIQNVQKNVRSRGYAWGSSTRVVWCHFPACRDMVRSIAGGQNLRLVRATSYGLIELSFAPECPDFQLDKDATPALPGKLKDSVATTMADLRVYHMHTLGTAAMNGDIDSMEYIVKKYCLSAHDLTHEPASEHGNSALMCAASTGQVAATRYLLKLGADPNVAMTNPVTIPNKHSIQVKLTPVGVAGLSFVPSSVEVLKLLCEARGDANTKCAINPFLDITVLHLSVFINSPEKVRVLLDHRADPCIESTREKHYLVHEDGRRPLSHAIAFDNLAAMDALLDHGVPLNEERYMPELVVCVWPLALAYQHCRIEAAKKLLRRGADPFQRLRMPCGCTCMSAFWFLHLKLLAFWWIYFLPCGWAALLEHCRLRRVLKEGRRNYRRTRPADGAWASPGAARHEKDPTGLRDAAASEGEPAMAMIDVEAADGQALVGEPIRLAE
eukprot:TRINITY_DN11437_c0_g1_i2.p1 TRINITY_DN11437_c0_g1~~TRINITY_DN11437_c0_g1_i2.p1  ORF type:complete len:987 (-),score=102.33 TRINITY_DN11437_c0_g1_i2:154-2823(-)